MAHLQRATAPDACLPMPSTTMYSCTTCATAQNDDYRFKFERGDNSESSQVKPEVNGNDNEKMAVVREGISGNGRITLYEPQDGQRQPRYNLTPNALSNCSEFDNDGARNACTSQTHTHSHTDNFGYIIILDVTHDLLLCAKTIAKKAVAPSPQTFCNIAYVTHGLLLCAKQ